MRGVWKSMVNKDYPKDKITYKMKYMHRFISWMVRQSLYLFATRIGGISQYPPTEQILGSTTFHVKNKMWCYTMFFSTEKEFSNIAGGQVLKEMVENSKKS